METILFLAHAEADGTLGHNALEALAVAQNLAAGLPGTSLTVGLVGADVNVTLEIEATVAAGVPANVVRIVTENGKTLKFTQQGFERD